MGAARCTRSKVGSEGNHSPAILDLVTPLLIPFWGFFMLNAAEGWLSSKKPEEERGRPSAYAHSDISPLSTLASAPQGNGSPGHSLLAPSLPAL